MRELNPNAFRAGALASLNRVVEDPLLRLVRNFEDSIALDTVRNEYLLHRQIHQWFAENQTTSDFDALNERVYAELFLTPSSDPWLGLVPPDTFSCTRKRRDSCRAPAVTLGRGNSWRTIITRCRNKPYSLWKTTRRFAEGWSGYQVIEAGDAGCQMALTREYDLLLLD